MKHKYQRFLISSILMILGSCAPVEKAEVGFDSTQAYRLIVQNESGVEVRDAISKLSKNYQKNLASGITTTEHDRDLILKAIPVIIAQMDDEDKELAIQVFYVLASLQSDCPAPKKKYWMEWWDRKQGGEAISWTVTFSAEDKSGVGSNETQQSNPLASP